MLDERRHSSWDDIRQAKDQLVGLVAFASVHVDLRVGSVLDFGIALEESNSSGCNLDCNLKKAVST